MMMMLPSRPEEFSWILDILHANVHNGSRESSCNLNMHLLPHQFLALRLMDSQTDSEKHAPDEILHYPTFKLCARCECGFVFSVDLVTRRMNGHPFLGATTS